MRKCVVGLSLAAVLFGLVSPARAQDKPKRAEVKVEKDIVFGKAGEDELHLDVYKLADQKETLPGVLVIYGGAWRSGNKEIMRIFCEQFCRAGYVVVASQYRLCPKHKFPAQVEDVKAAVRWMRANAKKLDLDPDRIGAMGASAGGHLSLMLGLMNPEDGMEGTAGNPEQSSKVQAVVNYFGPAKFTMRDWDPKDERLLVDFLGGKLDEVPDLYEKVSPTTYIDSSDPPVITFHGTQDPLVPYSQAPLLHSMLREKGVVSQLELVKGAGHGWWGADLQKTQRLAIEFLDKHLKGKDKDVRAEISGSVQK
jgi:acetyl esterase/lipase